MDEISIEELERRVKDKLEKEKIERDRKADKIMADWNEKIDRGTIENKTGKGRFDLLPPRAMTRLALRFEFGAKKYDDRDWEKGIQFSSLSSSALRHTFKYLKGDVDEDHLIAAVWNLMAIAEQEELIKEGRLSTELNDLKNNLRGKEHDK